MRSILILFTLLQIVNFSFGQNKEEIMEEAMMLYNSEKASWHGTDLFLEKFPEKRSQIGGYLSYSENDRHHCIFFDNEDDPNLLARLSFDPSFNIDLVEIDTVKRKLNEIEKELHTIRKIALNEIIEDTLFKRYKNTNLNPIPLINGKEKKVFVLTGPEVSGVLILGNDYLLTFDKNNKLKEKKVLHKNIIPIEFNEETIDAITMHSHLKSTGNLITSTDICTLMLYKEYTKWASHIVISKKNVSIWNSETDNLMIMSTKEWQKMADDVKEKEDAN